MDKDALRDYKNWIGKTPLEIRSHVRNVGGWTVVFPSKDFKVLPKWTHRLRNFFNEQPEKLWRVGIPESWIAINKIKLRDRSVTNQVVASCAFSGDVYKELKVNDKGDVVNRYWIEMSQAGSKYHSKEQRGVLMSALTPHSMTGNFKMISVDGTGGSSETALHNWMHGWTGKFGKSSKAEVGMPVNARTQAIIEEKYRGSYNFADSMDGGYTEHKRLDVVPDEKYGTRYISEGRWVSIGDRVFGDYSF